MLQPAWSEEGDRGRLYRRDPGPGPLSTQQLPAPPHRLHAPCRRERAPPPVLGLVFGLISSHLFALLPRQLHSKQRPGPPAAHASGSKLGTCLLCLLWGRRREQTAAFVSQVGYILHSIRALKRWRDAKDPSQSKHFMLTRLSEVPFHCICPLEGASTLMGKKRIFCILLDFSPLA